MCSSDHEVVHEPQRRGVGRVPVAGVFDATELEVRQPSTVITDGGSSDEQKQEKKRCGHGWGWLAQESVSYWFGRVKCVVGGVAMRKNDKGKYLCSIGDGSRVGERGLYVSIDGISDMSARAKNTEKVILTLTERQALTAIKP